jgi:hypothetical protein
VVHLVPQVGEPMYPPSDPVPPQESEYLIYRYLSYMLSLGPLAPPPQTADPHSTEYQFLYSTVYSSSVPSKTYGTYP